jgi:hypothetical protein
LSEDEASEFAEGECEADFGVVLEGGLVDTAVLVNGAVEAEGEFGDDEAADYEVLAEQHEGSVLLTDLLSVARAAAGDLALVGLPKDRVEGLVGLQRLQGSQQPEHHRLLELLVLAHPAVAREERGRIGQALH